VIDWPAAVYVVGLALLARDRARRLIVALVVGEVVLLPDTLAVLAEAKKIGEAPAKVTRKPAAKKSTRAVKPKKP